MFGGAQYDDQAALAQTIEHRFIAAGHARARQEQQRGEQDAKPTPGNSPGLSRGAFRVALHT
jgi:hypothetical protein